MKENEKKKNYEKEIKEEKKHWNERYGGNINENG